MGNGIGKDIEYGLMGAGAVIGGALIGGPAGAAIALGGVTAAVASEVKHVDDENVSEKQKQMNQQLQEQKEAIEQKAKTQKELVAESLGGAYGQAAQNSTRQMIQSLQNGASVQGAVSQSSLPAALRSVRVGGGTVNALTGSNVMNKFRVSPASAMRFYGENVAQQQPDQSSSGLGNTPSSIKTDTNAGSDGPATVGSLQARIRGGAVNVGGTTGQEGAVFSYSN
jgi:hypothetical protein